MEIFDPQKFHWVITYNALSCKWEVDFGITLEKFDDEPIMDYYSEKWYGEDTDPDNWGVYDQFSDVLEKTIARLNNDRVKPNWGLSTENEES